jgi:hypothetical protein
MPIPEATPMPTLPPAALCQDCLRLIRRCDLIPHANYPPGLCPHCQAEGRLGQTCDDRCCVGSAHLAALTAGDWARTGLQPHAAARAVSWTPDGGLVRRPA